jgi:hypothetical protein
MELADFLATSKRGITPGMGKPPRGSRSAVGVEIESD